jgi:hypothetical protein
MELTFNNSSEIEAGEFSFNCLTVTQASKPNFIFRLEEVYEESKTVPLTSFIVKEPRLDPSFCLRMFGRRDLLE